MPNSGLTTLNGSLRLLEGGVRLNDRNASNFDQELSYVRITVTNAEALALFATPKTLVPAPGAGRLLNFISAVVYYKAGATAFTTAAGRDLTVKYTNAAGTVLSNSLTTVGLADQATDQIRTLKQVSTDVTPVVNAPLVLHQLSANMTLGTGVFFVDVLYSIHTTGL